MCPLILYIACFILHFFFREKDGCNFDRTLYVEGLLDIPISVPQLARRSANYDRDHFANYFVGSEGAVHTQYDKV